MSRYLSFLRKRVHIGQEDSNGTPGLAKKRKNVRQMPPSESVADKATGVNDDGIVDSASLGESDESHSSVVKGELSLHSSRHGIEIDDGLDEVEADSAIDNVIDKAFDDLEIDLLTEALTGIKDNVGELFGTGEVKASVCQGGDEESVIIITETTEEEIIEYDTQSLLNEELYDQQLFVVDPSHDKACRKKLSKNEYAIKILVPSKNDTCDNVHNDIANENSARTNGMDQQIGRNRNFNKSEIRIRRSFGTFPSEKLKLPLRHSKSYESMIGASVINNSNIKKSCKRSSTIGTSSEDDFDSAKETLSDDDLTNVTRIYIKPTTDISAIEIDQIDCAIDTNCNIDSICKDTFLKEDSYSASIKFGNSVPPEQQKSDISMTKLLSEKSLGVSYDIPAASKTSAEIVVETPAGDNLVRVFNNEIMESIPIIHDDEQSTEKIKETEIMQQIGNEICAEGNVMENGGDEFPAKSISSDNICNNKCSDLILMQPMITLEYFENVDEGMVGKIESLDQNTSNGFECVVRQPKKMHSDCKTTIIDNEHSKSAEVFVDNRQDSSGDPIIETVLTCSVSKDSILNEKVKNVLNDLPKEVSSNKKTNRNSEELATNNITYEDVLQSDFITTVSMDHDEAETRLAQRRAARVEAREMRLKELEKQQEEEEDDDEEKQYVANDTLASAKRSKMTSQRLQSSANSKTPSRPARSSVGRSSLIANSLSQVSRRSSEDSIPDEALPAFAMELKAELKEMEEKFRKAMITNAQLDNDKTTLTYEVEFLKDKFSELEESHIQLTKDRRRKGSENEQLRKLTNKLKEEMNMLRKILQEREELIQEYGLVVVGEEENGEDSRSDDDEMMDDTINDLSPRKIAIKKALLSQEAAELLSRGAAHGSLDVRLKRYAEDKNELEDEVRRLKMELEEEIHRRRKENGLDSEKQKEISTYINEYKLRIQKSEAEVSTLQANVARLESLVTRYKAQAEELEKSEDELKTEKRKLLREFREAQTQLEETELINSHLQKRFDKLKTARSTLLKDLSLDPP